MVRAVRYLLAFCLFATLFSAAAWGASLKAGAAKVEITPQTGLRMYGYANRKSGAAVRAAVDDFQSRFIVAVVKLEEIQVHDEVVKVLPLTR